MPLIKTKEYYINNLSEKMQLFDDKLATVNDYDGFYRTLGTFIENIPEDFNFWKYYIQFFVEKRRKAPLVAYTNWNLFFVSNVPKIQLPTPIDLIGNITPYLAKSACDSASLTEEEEKNLANATVIVAIFIQFLYSNEEVLALFHDGNDLFFYITRIILNHKDNVVASTYATLAILGAFRVNNSLARQKQSETLKRIKKCSNLPCFIKALKMEAEVFYEKGETMCTEENAQLILRSIIAQRVLDCFLLNSIKADDLSRDMWIFGSDHQFGWTTHQSLTPIDHASGKKFYFEVFHCSLGSLRVGIAHKPTEKNLANWFDLGAFKSAITFDAFEKIHWVYGKERTCSDLSRPEKEGYIVGVTIDTTAHSALELIKFTVNGEKLVSDSPLSNSRIFPYAASNKKRKTVPLWHQPYYISFATSALQSCIVLRKKETWTFAPFDQADQLTEVDSQFEIIKSNLNPKIVVSSAKPPEASGAVDSQATSNFGAQESQEGALTIEPPRPKYHFVLRKSKRYLQKMNPIKQEEEQQQEEQPPQENKLELLKEHQMEFQLDNQLEFQEEQQMEFKLEFQKEHQQEHQQMEFHLELQLENQLEIQQEHQMELQQENQLELHEENQLKLQQENQLELQEELQLEQEQAQSSTVFAVDPEQICPAISLFTDQTFGTGEQIVIQSAPENFQNQMSQLQCFPNSIPQLQSFQPVQIQQEGIQQECPHLESFQSLPNSPAGFSVSSVLEYDDSKAATPPSTPIAPSPVQSESSLLQALGSPLSQTVSEIDQTPPYVPKDQELLFASLQLSPSNSSSSSSQPPFPVYQNPVYQFQGTPVTATIAATTTEPATAIATVTARASATVMATTSASTSTSTAATTSSAEVSNTNGQVLPPSIALASTLESQQDLPLPPVAQLQQIQFKSDLNHNKCFRTRSEIELFILQYQNLIAELTSQAAQQPNQGPLQPVLRYCIVANESAPPSVSQQPIPSPTLLQVSSNQDESVVRRTFVDLQSRDQQAAQSFVQPSHVSEAIRVQNDTPLPRTGFIQTEHGILFCNNCSKKTTKNESSELRKTSKNDSFELKKTTKNDLSEPRKTSKNDPPELRYFT